MIERQHKDGTGHISETEVEGGVMRAGEGERCGGVYGGDERERQM